MPAAAAASPHAWLQAQARWNGIEFAFWATTLLPLWVFPDYLVLASQIAITALFALSLDLILGYAGIVSLGHAAFFGLGAYTAGLAAKYGWGEPITGLILGALVAGLVGYAASFIIARFRHLALIMITLGMGLLLTELANSMHWLTGGAGRLYGGLVGAIIFMVARDQFSGNTPQFWYFWIGALLIAVVMFLPNGILGGLAKLSSAWRSKA
jgi:branched-chain amino acid transport system permease protein